MMELTGKQNVKSIYGAINKYSSTLYGKEFPKEKKYDNYGKYYPSKLIDNSHSNRFQTSDINFYNEKAGGAPKNFYTTSQNFSKKKTYENEYQLM